MTSTGKILFAGASIAAVAAGVFFALLMNRSGERAAAPERPTPPAISAVALPWSDGKTATLTWSVKGAATVSIDGEDVTPEGARNVPLVARQFHIRAVGPGGSAESTVELAADQAVPSPTAAKSSPKPSAPAAPGPVHMDARQLAPFVIQKATPVYPATARNGHVEGVVRFQAIIGADGVVKSLRLVDGHPLLVKAAADALAQWRCRPIVRDGHPVEVQTEFAVDFKLTAAQ